MLSIMLKRSRLILLSAFVGLILGAGITLLFPLEYRADAQVYIISKSRYGVDPYTIIRSAERVGENIAQVMGTNDFYDKVMSDTNYSIDRTYFEDPTITEQAKRKRWEKAIQGSVVFGTGTLTVSAYSVSTTQALALAGAAVDTLARRGWEYVGGDVDIKVVNEPVVTRFPVRPNLLVNALLGAVALMIIVTLALLRREYRPRW
jgi:capsular polysaccharide biosynthesis protein